MVGDIPVKDESDAGRPIAGKAGKILKEYLDIHGIDRDTVSVSNVVKCRPDEKDTFKVNHITECGDRFLANEVSSLKSLKLIVLLGKTAFSYFFNKGNYAKSCGHFMAGHGATFFCMLPPSQAYKREEEFSNDIKKIKLFLDGALFTDRNYIVVDSMDKLKAAEQTLSQYDTLSIDIETNIIPKRREIKPLTLKTFAISPEKNVSYGFYMECDKTISPRYHQEAWRMLSSFLVNPKIKKVFHNAAFECKQFRLRGCNPVNYDDTMIEAFLLDENRPINLKELAHTYTEGYKNLISGFNQTTEKLLGYNMEDADLTLQLHTQFKPALIKNKGLLWIYDNLMIPETYLFPTIEMNGVLFDTDYALELNRALSVDVGQLEASIFGKYPMLRNTNLDSPKQLAAFMFGVLGLKPKSETPTGRPSLAKNDLTLFKEDGVVLAEWILERRVVKKLISTYVKALPNLLGDDSKLSSSYSTTTAKTGRAASSKPNLQNIPRDKRVKNTFTPDPGNVFLQGDFSQAELRIAASIADEKRMIDIYRNDGDIHRLTASIVAGIPLAEVTKIHRQSAKAVNFGFIYGMEALGFKSYAKQDYNAEFTEKEAIRARELYFENYSALAPWHARVKRFAEKHGYVVSPLGRVRRLPDAQNHTDFKKKSSALRQALNAPVQATAADLTAYTMIRAQRFLEKMDMKSKLVLTVHDSIVFSAVPEEVEALAMFLTDTVTSLERKFSWLTVPMKMDFEIGDRWGALRECSNIEQLLQYLQL